MAVANFLSDDANGSRGVAQATVRDRGGVVDVRNDFREQDVCFAVRVDILVLESETDGLLGEIVGKGR